MMINVLIVDDHALIRAGVKKTLSGEPDMALVGEADNVVELFKQLQVRSVNIVLLDITMPGESGLDALRELHRKYPHLPVLILSFHPEHRFAVRALKAGAAGYITPHLPSNWPRNWMTRATSRFTKRFPTASFK
jgi:two-component system invasion response regulator UvrY